MNEKEILAGANERIQKYRTANLKIEVTDKQGTPLPQAQVNVQQTRHEFLFGCHLLRWEHRTDKEKETYWAHFKELHNYASVNFAWTRFEPKKGKPRHKLMNDMVSLCEAHKIACQGHLVIWNHHGCSPSWLPDDPAEVVKHCDAHVSDIVSRYKGRIKNYILVNEPTDCFRAEAPKEDAYDTAVTRAWQHEGRLPFAKRFFPIAHQADPGAVQLINDYRMDRPYEKIIEQLVDERGRPLYDAIGLQSHMHDINWGAKKTWDTCERFARFNKPLHFTEHTQLSGRNRSRKNIKWLFRDPNWKTTKAGEKRQAEIVAEFYTVVFSHPATQAISWFNFEDYGWLGAPGGLLYAKQLSPKPAYEKLHSLIKGEWWTQSRAETNKNGRCSVHAFFGDYTITAKCGSAKKKVEFRHTKSAKAPVKIAL